MAIIVDIINKGKAANFYFPNGKNKKVNQLKKFPSHKVF